MFCHIVSKIIVAGNWLSSFLQNMTTLGCITLQRMLGDIANSFVLAAVQNEAIHTMEIDDVSCSENVF